jgi:spermidine synthase
VFDHRREPPRGGAAEALWVAMRATRDRLLAFYRGALLYYAGQPQEMEAVLQKVFDEDPDNPYYRWFVGG